jgi:hemerythrin-like metal-binding protein
MALINWDEKYSVGVASVDHEHRELIELINATHEKLLRSESSGAVLEFLGEIYGRIAAHFALEERLMRKQHYSHYAGHKADHERLLDEIREIMDDYEDKTFFDEAQLAGRLHAWFSEHFRDHDARLHRVLV